MLFITFAFTALLSLKNSSVFAKSFIKSVYAPDATSSFSSAYSTFSFDLEEFVFELLEPDLSVEICTVSS